MNNNDSSKKKITIRVKPFNGFHTVMTVIAILLSLRRNHGFHFGSFLAAIFLSPFYIIYTFAVPVHKDFRQIPWRENRRYNIQ